MIKRAIQFTASIAFLALASGCIDSTTTVILKKDGSGLISETTYMSAAAAQMIAGMMGNMAAEMGGEMGGKVTMKSPSSTGKMPIEEDKYKAKAKKMGDGVSYYKAYNVKKDDGSEGVRVLYKFKDINKLQLSQNPDAPNKGGPGGGMMGGMGGPPMQGGGMMPPPGMGQPMGMETPEPQETPITFSFTPGTKAKLIVRLPPPKPTAPSSPNDADEEMDAEGMDMGPGGGMDDAQGMQMMKAMFSGMRVKMMIRVDGEITDTNASHTYSGATSGKKCFVSLFDMNIGKLMEMPEQMEKLEALGPGSDISTAKEVLKGITGIKIEPEQKVSITFQ